MIRNYSKMHHLNGHDAELAKVRFSVNLHFELQLALLANHDGKQQGYPKKYDLKK